MRTVESDRMACILLRLTVLFARKRKKNYRLSLEKHDSFNCAQPSMKRRIECHLTCSCREEWLRARARLCVRANRMTDQRPSRGVSFTFCMHSIIRHVSMYRHKTALHLVCSSPYGRSAEIINALIGAGARVNQPDNGQQTPLHLAVVHGSHEDVEALLNNKADPNLFDNMGHSCLHLAAKRQYTPVMTSPDDERKPFVQKKTSQWLTIGMQSFE
jgi:hypothetical protein